MPCKTNDCVGTGSRATRASSTPYVALNPTAMIASSTWRNLTTTKSDIAGEFRLVGAFDAEEGSSSGGSDAYRFSCVHHSARHRPGPGASVLRGETGALADRARRGLL